MTRIHFEIRDGVYPRKVGGMEVFNYYLTRELGKRMDISYAAEAPLNHGVGRFCKMRSIRPIKYLAPLRFAINACRKHPDVVVLSFSTAHSITWKLYGQTLRLLNIPYVVVIHHGKVPDMEHRKDYARFFKSAKAVIAVSEDIKKNYDALYGIDCKVIPPLVPFEHSKSNRADLTQKYGLPEKGTIIGMVGSIKRMKNPDTLLRAIGEMSTDERTLYNPIAVYAGSGEEIENLKRLAEELDLTERVYFLGFIPKEDVKELMVCLDYYVIASDYEGTSVSLLEAMYNKKPILASDVTGINDTVSQEEAMFFQVKNTFQLKDRLLQLFKDDKKREKISEAAFHRYMIQYDYSRMIEQYIDIFRR